jgi:hypothetical protein
LGNRPTTCHRKQAVREINCDLGTVRPSVIHLDSGKGYEVGDEDSKLEGGIVYKQILINVKLQIVRSGKKQNDWEVYKGGEGPHWTIVPFKKKEEEDEKKKIKFRSKLVRVGI